MDFLHFKEQLKSFGTFSLGDIRMVENTFHRRRLNEWQDKGYIKKIVRGHYIFSDVGLSEPLLYKIAKSIYAPSYVTCETALGYYGLIPESVYGIVSASMRKTTRFSTFAGRFSYHALKRQAFFGYAIVERNGVRFKIAEIEKAVVDYLYLHAGLKRPDDFESIRFNGDVFRAKIDETKLESLCRRIDMKALTNRANGLLRYMRDA